MKKQINKSTISLLLVFLLLPILSVLMFVHITVSETIANMDSGSFGEGYELISVEWKQGVVQEIYEEVDDMKERVAITSDGEIDDVNVRSIYFNKSYVYLPMKTGRFFEKKDLCNGNDCAVVGKALEEKVYTRNGKKYITLQNKELEVLGVIGYECETVMDDYVYVNGCIQEELFDSTLFLVDFFDGKELDNTMENLAAGLGRKEIYVERLSGGQNFFHSFIPRMLYSRWFVMMFLCTLLCLLLLSYEWVDRQREEIGIRRLLGATPGDIYYLLGKRYGGMILLTMGVAFLYCHMFHPDYKRFLVSGYIFVLPVLFLFFGCVCVRLQRAPLEEVIK